MWGLGFRCRGVGVWDEEAWGINVCRLSLLVDSGEGV